MEFDGHISASAFLVNESRARNVSLSRDRYAHLWVTDETQTLWEEFSREVYPYDAIELGIRNRFFLSRLNGFVRQHPQGAFINLAAGFTSYPFLLDAPYRCVEVDLKPVITFKRHAITAWQAAGLMPARDVEFVAADLTTAEGIDSFRQALGLDLADGTSFVLLEGITYYLSMIELRRLWRALGEMQGRGSVLAFDFWTPDQSTNPVFARFVDFFAQRLGRARTQYNLFDLDDVPFSSDYALVERTNVQDQERVDVGTSQLADEDQILPEHYAVLRRR